MIRPRLALVTPEVHRRGGTERSVAEQIERWRDRFDIALYTMQTEDLDLHEVHVRRLRALPGPHVVRYLWWVGANHLLRWWDARVGERPDVVYSTGVNCLDARAVSVHIVFEALWRAVRRDAQRDLRHPTRMLRALHRISFWTLLRVLERRVYGGPATLWAVSRRQAAILEREFHRPKGTIPVVPHGVDCSAFSTEGRQSLRDDARRALGLGPERLLLLVGNDWHNKGVAVALRALARLPERYHLAVVGRDEARPFAAIAESLNVGARLRQWPHLPDVRPYYAAADCLIAPSREDAFHMPTLEALACGLPAIVSSRAGVSELLEDGRHALVLQDPEDHETLARLAARVFDEPGLATRLAREGRALAERCSWDANADRAAALIEREATTPRVIVLAPDPWGTGGIERATRTLIGALAELYGAERVGLIPVWGAPPDATDLPCRVLWSRPGRPSPRRGGRVGPWRKLGSAFAALRAARRWRGRSTVVIAAHVHLAPVGWFAHVLSGAPCLTWAYGLEAWGGMRRAVVHALRRAQSVFAISRFTADALHAAAGVAPDVLHVVPLSLGDWQALAHSRRAPGVRGVLSVARLRRDETYKGVDSLILAWPLVLTSAPDAALLIVGDGDDRERLTRLVARLGLDGRVRFLGRVDDGTLAECYASASVFALPGRVRLGRKPQGEGFGLVFLEAAAAGLPCVAGRAGGAVEAVEDGVTGLLVDPEQPRLVADAIARLLLDPDLARRMGEAGRERVASQFSYERFRDRVGDLVNGLLHS